MGCTRSKADHHVQPAAVECTRRETQVEEMLQERPELAVLADVHEDTNFVRWTAIWHRPSRWRGLWPGEGIPDELRLARTLCAEFIPSGFEQSLDVQPAECCAECEREYVRPSGGDVVIG